jgi:flavin reductase (DIM6/NTAB) family NADH-FMN oxidoreductase RutF
MTDQGGLQVGHASDQNGVREVDCAEGRVDLGGLRSALGRFATGVTVITTRTPDGKLEGLTANSFSSLSLDPPLVLWSIRSNAPSLEGFLQSGSFAVNVLGAEQVELARHFSTPRIEKFGAIAHVQGHGGCPTLPGCLAVFQCVTENTVEGGDHLLFIGRVIRARHRDGDPLIFSGGRYSVRALLPSSSDAAARRFA